VAIDDVAIDDVAIDDVAIDDVAIDDVAIDIERSVLGVSCGRSECHWVPGSRCYGVGALGNVRRVAP
jgi:hypothetical protein